MHQDLGVLHFINKTFILTLCYFLQPFHRFHIVDDKEIILWFFKTNQLFLAQRVSIFNHQNERYSPDQNNLGIVFKYM